MQHPDEDDLALLAMGETPHGVVAHVQGWPPAPSKVTALRSTVQTVRGAGLTVLPPPPPAVWERISSELGLAPAPAAAPLGRLRRRRTLAVGAALTAAAAAVVAVLAVVVTGPASGPAGSTLEALGEVPAAGTVVVTDGEDRRTLLVDTTGLPEPDDGAYEVWLLDVEDERLVTLGVLDPSGRAWIALPEGVELDDYPLVDISLEPDDGDPGHSGDSVLRGDVPL